MTRSLIERLARINDPTLWATLDDDPDTTDAMLRRGESSSLTKAAKCLAEVALELGSQADEGQDPFSLAVNLHISGEAEVVRMRDRLVVRCGPGAMSKHEEKD